MLRHAMLSLTLMLTRASCDDTDFSVAGFEAEYLSLLHPEAPNKPLWGRRSPPVIDAGDDGNILFEWRIGASARTPRNVTIAAAELALQTAHHPTIRCRATASPRLSVLCGAGQWSAVGAATYNASLNVTLCNSGGAIGSAGGSGRCCSVSVTGSFIRGLLPTQWGAAEWVGLADPNATAAQHRAARSVHELGFVAPSDVAQATLFVAGLGGHRASVNGRPLDPAGVRGTVTEWSNRTFYFADDVTLDVRASAASADGMMVVAVELYKHWYGLSNAWLRRPYGPRSLKAVLVLHHANGTVVYALPTCSADTAVHNHCDWRHGIGPTVHEDLHTGQTVDARLAVPGWDTAGPTAATVAGWAAPASVVGPPGMLKAHPMQRSRVLEVVRPIAVEAVPADNLTAPASYRFTLPHEIAGFCTLLLPEGTPTGTRVTLRQGEAVNRGTGHLVDVTCSSSLGPNGGLGCVTLAYTARGDARGMDAHDAAWRRMAGGTSGQEAFTPAFQFSGFRYVQVAYAGPSTLPPTNASLACYRVGTAFDWTGDVAVAAPRATPQDEAAGSGSGGVSGTTAAERFNAVTAAARSSAISNYLFDVPTDCPHREKRGWTGDSLAAHRTLAALFDVRAAWVKWVDDIVLAQALLEPAGTVPIMAPCVFAKGVQDWKFFCKGDPRSPVPAPAPVPDLADVAWGSVLPLLADYTVKFTGDTRLAARAAAGAAAYVNLLHSYANSNESGLPGLLNTTAWPKSTLGDWFPAKGGGARSVSTLLNSHHLILDADAAAALQAAAAPAGRLSQATPPVSASELRQWASIARRSFVQAFLTNVSIPVLGRSAPRSGLAFHDWFPPSAPEDKNVPPALQTEACAGMAAMDQAAPGILSNAERVALVATLAELVLFSNATVGQRAVVTGGIIDTAHLAPELVAYGRPDVAFELLAADGLPSFYNMAKYGGTLWETWDNADGCDTPAGCVKGPAVETKGSGVGSLNHVMFAGSVSAAVFGIGGIRPGVTSTLAPVPWLPDAPRGAAVHRSRAGPAAVAWAAAHGGSEEPWRIWVNASVPVGVGQTELHVMLPQGTGATDVCAWECGNHTDISTAVRPYTDEWVAFDAGGGHREYRAIVPEESAITGMPPNTHLSLGCAPVWRSAPVHLSEQGGINRVDWLPAEPGRNLYPALVFAVTSGDYYVYAKECASQ